MKRLKSLNPTLLTDNQIFNMVQPVGIEPTSTVLHTAAMTTSAKVALFGGSRGS